MAQLQAQHLDSDRLASLRKKSKKERAWPNQAACNALQWQERCEKS